ncbi:MAG: hypothetical protein K8T25_11425 [Planctomycetia bacterium]|nr:hypothetical protein [Planctomycetia bacterium]
MNPLEEATCWELVQELVSRSNFDGLIVFDTGSMPDCDDPPAMKLVKPLAMRGVRVNQFMIAIFKMVEANFRKWEEENESRE